MSYIIIQGSFTEVEDSYIMMERSNKRTYLGQRIFFKVLQLYEINLGITIDANYSIQSGIQADLNQTINDLKNIQALV